MDDPYARRKIFAGIIVTILLLVLLIGEAMRDQTLRRWAYAWLGVIFASIGVIIVLLWMLFSPVIAHDLEHPELDDWFMSLRSKKGMCCDGGEALHLTNVDWETKGGHYRVRVPIDGDAYDRARKGEVVDTDWVDVPDDAVIDEPNKVGQTLVWPVYYTGSTVWIRCFLPGSLT